MQSRPNSPSTLLGTATADAFATISPSRRLSWPPRSPSSLSPLRQAPIGCLLDGRFSPIYGQAAWASSALNDSGSVLNLSIGGGGKIKPFQLIETKMVEKSTQTSPSRVPVAEFPRPVSAALASSFETPVVYVPQEVACYASAPSALAPVSFSAACDNMIAPRVGVTTMAPAVQANTTAALLSTLESAAESLRAFKQALTISAVSSEELRASVTKDSLFGMAPSVSLMRDMGRDRLDASVLVDFPTRRRLAARMSSWSSQVATSAALSASVSEAPQLAASARLRTWCARAPPPALAPMAMSFIPPPPRRPPVAESMAAVAVVPYTGSSMAASSLPVMAQVPFTMASFSASSFASMYADYAPPIGSQPVLHDAASAAAAAALKARIKATTQIHAPPLPVAEPRNDDDEDDEKSKAGDEDAAESDSDDENVVKEVTGRRYREHKRQWQVVWKKTGQSEWVADADCTGCNRLIEEYKQRENAKRRARTGAGSKRKLG